MTRREAIKVAYGIPVTKAQHEALQFLIPELTESEDEKFRKYILRACKECVEANDKGLELSMDTTKKLLSYLEKQKEEEGYEAIPVESTLEYKLGFKAGKESEKQKEPENASTTTMAPSCWAEELSLQKEQKPAECIPDSVKFDEGFKTGREVGFREGVESVKAAELTPLATLLSNYLKNDFEYFATKKWDEKKWNEVMNIQASELLRTAKNELEQEQKPAWSEEDEEIFNNIIEKAKGGHWIEVNEITWLINRFKSPRPSWKPSEEQMEALKNSAYGVYQNGDGPALRELYEQLKKLT